MELRGAGQQQGRSLTDSCNFELKKTKCMQNDAPLPFLWLKAAVPVGVERRDVGGERSVGKSLAGLFPAAGRAPHVAVLHPVHLTALLPFTTNFPTEGSGGSGRGREDSDGL